jgi:beta-glucosidase-like glycosyl hydrolase
MKKIQIKILAIEVFLAKKKFVKILGNITVKQCQINRIISVIKHIPGHGFATSDSHYKTPKVDLSYEGN